MFADHRVQFGVGLRRIPRLDLVFDERRHRVLRENLPGEANAGAELLPVLRVTHVVERDLRVIARIA